MVEAPEKIWIDSVRSMKGFVAVAGSSLPHVNGGVEYLRSDIAERENAELTEEVRRQEIALRGAILAYSSYKRALEAAEADKARLSEALRNLAHEMRFMLRANPDKDGGLYRQRLDEAETVLKENCQHGCESGGVCLANISGYPESCPTALSGSGAGGWRTMKSAPRDGTRILVCRKRPRSGSMSKNPAIASWNGLRADGARPGWVLEIKTNTYPAANDELLGWMPLPAAPTATGGR